MDYKWCACNREHDDSTHREVNQPIVCSKCDGFIACDFCKRERREVANFPVALMVIGISLFALNTRGRRLRRQKVPKIQTESNSELAIRMALGASARKLTGCLQRRRHVQERELSRQRSR